MADQQQQLAAVKSYIAKHNLESELSNAVNHAIKLDSDDPYRVISDYLRQFAKEQEEEEEDDVILEGEEPVRPMPGRRAVVNAPKFEIPEDWVPPHFEKDDKDQEWLKEVMNTNKLLKNLTPSDREKLMWAFELKEFEDGETIIKEGDKFENMSFYILATGTCDISVSSKGTVMKATKGVAFGELALLHNDARAATCTAEGKVTAWALDAISFKSTLMNKAQKDTGQYQTFLTNVPLLKDISDENRLKMLEGLKEEEYLPGTHIICQGDPGDNFYIIRSGEVKCTQGDKEVSRRLKEGDFFGELALLSTDKRQATVTATEPTTVLVLARDKFNAILGPLKELMEKTTKDARM